MYQTGEIYDVLFNYEKKTYITCFRIRGRSTVCCDWGGDSASMLLLINHVYLCLYTTPHVIMVSVVHATQSELLSSQRVCQTVHINYITDHFATKLTYISTRSGSL